MSGGDTGPTDDGVDVVDELDCLLDIGEAGLTSAALMGSTLNAVALACGLNTACLACGLSAAGLMVAAGESTVVGLCVEADTLPLGVCAPRGVIRPVGGDVGKWNSRGDRTPGGTIVGASISAGDPVWKTVGEPSGSSVPVPTSCTDSGGKVLVLVAGVHCLLPIPALERDGLLSVLSVGDGVRILGGSVDIDTCTA